MKIPDGVVIVELPLESAKSYPTRIFEKIEDIKIAYSDIQNKENIWLGIKYIEKTNKIDHPQIVFYIKGDYHKEKLEYYTKNPLDWSTWIEFHLNSNKLDQLITNLKHIQRKIKFDK